MLVPLLLLLSLPSTATKYSAVAPSVMRRPLTMCSRVKSRGLWPSTSWMSLSLASATPS